ncbi:Ribosome-recycling factor [Frankliniella fusca]|uniref:Ribosome-recycling factor n=1 Tax=Frankliniella fusca TaxID=407009 RepID=A0AAE1LCV8_9NEOP|nr:Ribosome-recycling factor [Frankliniella fusca]
MKPKVSYFFSAVGSVSVWCGRFAHAALGAGSRGTTASIVQRHVAGKSREAAVKLPNKASLARVVRRVKRSSLPEDPKDIEDMVVISEQHLHYLAKATYWIMDGTFKSAPGVFYQLYTLHDQVHGQWFPLVMVLMVNRSKDMYIELFELLQHEIAGCLFHLGQSFWRKLQNARLAEEYREEDNEDMRTSFHSLIAVAFCHRRKPSVWMEGSVFIF